MRKTINDENGIQGTTIVTSFWISFPDDVLRSIGRNPSKGGLDVSSINRHKTRVDEVMIKVGLTQGDWYEGLDNEEVSRQTIFKLIGMSDSMTRQH